MEVVNLPPVSKVQICALLVLIFPGASCYKSFSANQDGGICFNCSNDAVAADAATVEQTCEFVECRLDQFCDVELIKDVLIPTDACQSATSGNLEHRSADGPSGVCTRWNGRVPSQSAPIWNGDAQTCDLAWEKFSDRLTTVNDTLRELNFYRWMTGLPSNIGEDTSAPDANLNQWRSPAAQACAVMMAANAGLSNNPHQPQCVPGWKCTVPDPTCPIGNTPSILSRYEVQGAYSSNISQGQTHPALSVDIFMADNDQDANRKEVGHRRWLLSQRMQNIGIGFARDTNGVGYTCLGVLDGVLDGSRPYTRPWTAYPPPGPAPKAITKGPWTFHIQRFGPNSCCSEDQIKGTTVTVIRSSDGATMPIQVNYPSESYAETVVGWTFTNSNASPEAGQSYDVTVTLPFSYYEQSVFTYKVNIVDC